MKQSSAVSLIDSLEQDYTEQLQTSAAEEITALREALSQHPLPEQVTVYDHRYVQTMLAPLLFLNFNLLAWLIFFYQAIQPGFSFSWVWAAVLLGLGAFTALISYIPVMSFRHRNTPLLVISLAGIQFRDAPKLIPWTAVDDFSVTKFNVAVIVNVAWIVEFRLRHDYPVNWSLPALVPVKYNRNKHRIVLNCAGVKPAGKQVVDYIGHYHAQSWVRARLAELGEEV